MTVGGIESAATQAAVYLRRDPETGAPVEWVGDMPRSVYEQRRRETRERQDAQDASVVRTCRATKKELKSQERAHLDLARTAQREYAALDVATACRPCNSTPFTIAASSK